MREYEITVARDAAAPTFSDLEREVASLRGELADVRKLLVASQQRAARLFDEREAARTKIERLEGQLVRLKGLVEMQKESA